MKVRIAFAVLFAALVALCAFGQTFQRSLPFLAKSGTPPETPPWFDYGLVDYWVWTNSTPGGGVARVSNWVSSISATVWTNGALTTCPSNNGIGVFFDNFNKQSVLTSAPVTFGTNFSIGMMVTPRRFSFAVNMLAKGTETLSTAIYLKQSNSNIVTDVRNQAGAQGGLIEIGYAGSFTNDYVICYSNSALPSGGGILGYLNGVLTTNVPMASQTNNLNAWRQLGGINGYDGTVLEVAYWSNTVSSINASNWHYHRTNTYGGGP